MVGTLAARVSSTQRSPLSAERREPLQSLHTANPLARLVATLARGRVIAVLVLALVGATFAPLASAHSAAPSRPAGVYCNTTAWVTYWGNSYYFAPHLSPQLWLKAGLSILVDSNDHSVYCGSVQSHGHDELDAGCATFGGGVYINSFNSTDYSVYSVLHCTATTYDFAGYADGAPCLTGDKLYAYATDGDGDFVYYGPWTCTTP